MRPVKEATPSLSGRKRRPHRLDGMIGIMERSGRIEECLRLVQKGLLRGKIKDASIIRGNKVIALSEIIEEALK